jgi:hypothetical protein
MQYLLNRAHHALREGERWGLDDAQEAVASAVADALAAKGRTVLIVTGPPGTGKTATGIHLLADAHHRGLRCAMTNPSRAFIETMRRVVCTGSKMLQERFLPPGRVLTRHWPEALDLLVCDGAQHLRAHSATTRFDVPKGERRPQALELIESARVSVFFIDEPAARRGGEVATAASIRAAAAALGDSVTELALTTGHREADSPDASPCLDWVEDLLWPRATGPRPWTGQARFDLAVVDSIEVAEEYLGACGTGSVRLLAGECWSASRWPKGGEYPADVRIGPWARPWPNPGNRALPGAPEWRLWAAQGGFGQVGHVGTAAEFEFDYTGVIIGPDLRWRDRRMVTVPESHCDGTITGIPADRHIRAAYRTLLTRARLGTVLYAVDGKTRQQLAHLIQEGPR